MKKIGVLAKVLAERAGVALYGLESSLSSRDVMNRERSQRSARLQWKSCVWSKVTPR